MKDIKNTLQDKRILIAGGSSGIGLAIAVRAGELGAKVIVVSRTAGHKRELLAALVGESVELHSCDVTSESALHRLFVDIGAIDHLVITIRPELASAPFGQADIRQVRQAFETKFWGQYLVIRHAAPHIDQHGSITLTSGIAGLKIYRGSSAMAIINAATETLGRSLALELAPIRVNTVSPGFVAPKPPETERYLEQAPLKRLARPEEIAEQYISLMTSEYITGTTVVVDGGAVLM